ncbi:Ankyrin repeat-containing domain [Phytophthora cactorum]|nr:Ankyrin repeat-containing domain [Phytophthora cactorum]
MVQMGALFNQPLHCRKKPLQQDRASPRDILPNTMAVHSAAITGYEDIVLLLLQADNMMDLNMPTFHSKDMLTHLAVKNSLRDLFNNLAWLGADLCIKSGDGRRVCDVTHDEEWAREIATYIPQSSGQTGQHSRKRNTCTSCKATRQPLSRCSEMNTPSNAGVRTGKKTNNKKGKKGKKKKKKKKARRTPQKEESIIAAAAEPKDTRFEEKLRLLVSLLVSAGLNFEAKTDSASVTTLEELLMTTVAALFSRLRTQALLPAKNRRC